MTLTAILIGLVGCAGDPVINGTVTYDGTPIEEGGITFVPDDSKGKMAATGIANGKYTFTADRSPAPGKYKVQVQKFDKTGKKVSDGEGGMSDVKSQSLPDKFNKATTLTADVKSGAQTIDFALTK